MRVTYLLAVILVTLASATQIVAAAPLSKAQKTVLSEGIYFFNTEITSCGDAGEVTGLTGGSNPERVWNYFKGQGLDDIRVAAIMGSLQQESGFNPKIIQGGGTTDNPSNISVGWGLAQWTPGSKLIGIAAGYNITSPIGDLLTQLNIIWKELGDVSPAGKKNMLPDFKATPDLASAVDYFTANFEAAGIIGPRLTNAQNALKTYGGNITNGDTTDNTTSGCASGTADCTSATGVAKILCAAKPYDPASYEESARGGHQGGAAWHATCKTIDSSCLLDCSGLVNIAVYDAFGVDLQENTGGERDDIGKYWKEVTFAELQPGDLIQPNTGHVEIVDHVSGTTIYTFGAHDNDRPQPEQVSPTNYKQLAGQLYLHYIGPGV